MGAKMNKKTLGDRMKEYYEKPSRHCFPGKSNIIIRIDGKAFHTFTKGFDKPFDHQLMDAMHQSALSTARNIQGFKAGYVQSDEASFWFHDKENIDTEPWFGNRQDKINSVTCSLFTAFFNKYIAECMAEALRLYHGNLAFFDCRSFVIPTQEVTNYFVWRAKDWERNSIQMYAGSCFSHKQLHKKKQADMHEMLHGVGKNWTKDLNDREKNGVFIYLSEQENNITYTSKIEPHYNEINKLIEPRLGETS
jgi:tRNA(His) 5'-end guanylyltransferase